MTFVAESLYALHTLALKMSITAGQSIGPAEKYLRLDFNTTNFEMNDFSDLSDPLVINFNWHVFCVGATGTFVFSIDFRLFAWKAIKKVGVYVHSLHMLTLSISQVNKNCRCSIASKFMVRG